MKVNIMTLNEYQESAMTTCMPSSENFSYMFLNLVGEVGEFASKVAKAIEKRSLLLDGKKSRKRQTRIILFLPALILT